MNDTDTTATPASSTGIAASPAAATPVAATPAAASTAVATATAAAASAFFPVFLRLTGRRVLVVGGGPVATSKLQGLLDAGAHITIVAPDVTAEIEATVAAAASSATRSPAALSSAATSEPAAESDVAAAPAPATSAAAVTVTLHRRPFTPADLEGAWLVVAAATPEVNRAVAQAAEARAVFVNAVDDPPNATAYLGGVVRRDGVTVAISTDGRAPALAGLLREALDALLPRDLDRWMDASRAIRQEWIADRVPMEERRPLLLRRLNELYAQRAVAQHREAQHRDAPPAVAVAIPVATGLTAAGPQPALAAAGQGAQDR
jgi:siroheme synthase-like protein